LIKEKGIKCRNCDEILQITFANLGTQPICETYLTSDEITKKEIFYPLHVYICKKCLLVQLADSVSPEELFREYSYFSSHSRGWINHIKSFSEIIIEKLKLSSQSNVVEVGSNDGYLLKFFLEKKIPVLGIEAAENVAREAIAKGIPTLIEFFNEETSKKIIQKNGKSDLIIGNNILAQVPKLHDFIENLKKLLKPKGIMTFEFHHLLNLINDNQFDTISHERFSYLSFFIIEKLFLSHDLIIYDVEEYPTHGGSLRIYVRHKSDNSKPVTSKIEILKDKEISNGLTKLETYLLFEEKVKDTKRKILKLLINLKQKKKSIVGYGAHSEAHTLLNYCGITSDFLDFTVDRNPIKQKKYIAGVHIPIFNPEEISNTKPDYVIVLPWNIKEEIMKQMQYISQWNGKFIVFIPEINMYNADRSEISIRNMKENVRI
jgi:SAM-dependent methyltransferase